MSTSHHTTDHILSPKPTSRLTKPDNKQAAVICNKMGLQDQQIWIFSRGLVRDYLVQKSWLLNIFHIIVLAIRMIGEQLVVELK